MSVALAARVLQKERDRLLLPLRVQRAVVPAKLYFIWDRILGMISNTWDIVL